MYSLDAQTLFDPFELDTGVTPVRIRAALRQQDYTRAILMAFRLNERKLLREALESVPWDEGERWGGSPRAGSTPCPGSGLCRAVLPFPADGSRPCQASPVCPCSCSRSGQLLASGAVRGESAGVLGFVLRSVLPPGVLPPMDTEVAPGARAEAEGQVRSTSLGSAVVPSVGWAL